VYVCHGDVVILEEEVKEDGNAIERKEELSNKVPSIQLSLAQLETLPFQPRYCGDPRTR
jgi:hypothetical protein